VLSLHGSNRPELQLRLDEVMRTEVTWYDQQKSVLAGAVAGTLGGFLILGIAYAVIQP
jgi:hypothetical protein